MALPKPRFLVISLGNPAPYFNTLHSAGHHALIAVQQLLNKDGGSQQEWADKYYGRQPSKSQTSVGPDFLLMQSPTQMNVSGPWVRRAYEKVLTKHGLTHGQLGVVLVHDDLDKPMGVVTTKSWLLSHRGHNGVKSVYDKLPIPGPKAKWSRILIGIGRPASRDPDAVRNYVLKEMNEDQMHLLYHDVGPKVADIMRGKLDAWIMNKSVEDHGKDRL